MLSNWAKFYNRLTEIALGEGGVRVGDEMRALDE
jgi:hypothetical protein